MNPIVLDIIGQNLENVIGIYLRHLDFIQNTFQKSIEFLYKSSYAEVFIPVNYDNNLRKIIELISKKYKSHGREGLIFMVACKYIPDDDLLKIIIQNGSNELLCVKLSASCANNRTEISQILIQLGAKRCFQCGNKKHPELENE